MVDDSHIQGLFDLTLQWNSRPGGQPSLNPPRSAAAAARDGPRPDRSSLPSLSTALLEQVGVKLETGRASVDVYVIDRVESLRPK